MLRELQRDFARAVSDADPALAAQVRAGRFPAEQHVQIYRNNVSATLAAVLGDVYPVVEKLVGSGFFGYAVHEFLRTHRPLAANLHDFGGAFADFLAGFAPAASLPYLPDVARLEWAWHRAFHAADAERFDPARLATVPPERLPALRFILHPSAQLVSSPWPIVRIFEVNQDEYAGDATVDLEAGGVTALVIRRGLSVQVEPLAAGEAALLAALLRNQTLDEALQAALEQEPDFDLQRALADHVQRGTLCRIEIS
jgi:hypothetical protein